jgi:hypothetical protein
MKDGEGKRKAGYETREFKSKWPYVFLRIICGMRCRAAVGVVYSILLQYQQGQLHTDITELRADYWQTRIELTTNQCP